MNFQPGQSDDQTGAHQVPQPETDQAAAFFRDMEAWMMAWIAERNLEPDAFLTSLARYIGADGIRAGLFFDRLRREAEAAERAATTRPKGRPYPQLTRQQQPISQDDVTEAAYSLKYGERLLWAEVPRQLVARGICDQEIPARTVRRWVGERYGPTRAD